MNQKLIAEIGKSQRLLIINALKRTRGLSVGELALRLKMSYMGIKRHCIDLEKKRYVDTWRRPKPVGRPELVYRLTRRAHELFPVASNRMTIDLLRAAEQLYGPAASQKLLFRVFQQQGAHYIERLKGTGVKEKAKWLARLRDHEGCMAEFEDHDGLRIVEYHSPILDLLEAFPIVARLESELFESVLQAPVRREDATVSGLYCCIFHIDEPE